LVWTKNEKRVIRVMEELASSKPDSVTEVDEVAESLQLCTACQKYGCLVMCSGDSCLNRYHWKCSGVTVDEVGGQDYFCQDCDPTFVANIQSQRCTKCRKQIQDGCLVMCSGDSCLNRYHWKCSGVTADEVGGQDYFCQDCDSNFVADIHSQRSVPSKPKKRPPRPSSSHQTDPHLSSAASTAKRQLESDGTGVSAAAMPTDEAHASVSAAAFDIRLQASSHQTDPHSSSAASTAKRQLESEGTGISAAAKPTDEAHASVSAAAFDVGFQASSHQIGPGLRSLFDDSDSRGVNDDAGFDHIRDRMQFLDTRLSCLESSSNTCPTFLSTIDAFLAKIEAACHCDEMNVVGRKVYHSA
jgi:hypothetical protein